MKSKTVNISFQENLLDAIDKTAQEEHRSRSELIREAARMYIERKSRWKAIFEFGELQAQRLSLRSEDVEPAIQSYRQKKP